MQLSLFIAEGIDKSNPSGEETIITIKVNETDTLRFLHSHLLSQLQLVVDSPTEEENDLFYTTGITANDEAYDMAKSFVELGLVGGEKIYLDSKARRQKQANLESRRLVKPVFRLLPVTSLQENEENANAITLQLLCTTRLLDNDNNPLRTVHVVVRASHLISYLMEDIGTMWNKTGLKFRCGRIVLSPDKTFWELGIEDGSEIIVTGGRG